MAGFEVSRVGSLGEMAREWRFSKYLPLYLAGLAVGAAFGVGVAIQFGGEPAATSRAFTTQAVPAAAPETNWATMPAINSNLDAGEIETDLPATILLALHGYAPVTAAAPEVPASEPVIAAPVLAAPTNASAAPVTPAIAPVAVRPVAQPESAPVPAAAAAPAAPPAAAAKSDFYVPAVAGGGASNLEFRLFAGINSERAAAGLPALALDSGLTKVARTRSQQMADQGYFGHVDPAGYSMYTALLKYFGYSSYAWAGENLAMNNAAAAEASERSLVSLMNSSTHRANILASDFSRIGVGEVTTADGRHIFAMIFLG
ncbi:MAG: CAP domain-containing protein [Tepidiformaceae bacterium]